MSERKATRITGVRFREHETRKYGKQKDRYYYIRYKKNKKDNEEGLGWASQGWSEQKAGAILFEIKENIKFGRSPQSFKEMRKVEMSPKSKEVVAEKEDLSDVITVREIFEKYLDVHKTSTVKSTWKRTESCYFVWIDKKLGNRKLAEITIDDIQPIITKAIETRAPRTASYIKAVIGQLFIFAKKRELYSKDNPTTHIKIKKNDNKRNRFLTKQEARILIDELKIRSIDVHDMALLSLYSGMRAGEIFNLQWGKVLWDVERIFIADPKNGEGRMEPMHILVKEMLKRRYVDSQTGYVFKAKNGGKIMDLSDTFQRTVDKLGFNDGIEDSRQKVVFHTLRHTYASWLVMSSVDLYTTQRLMGHKSIQMTQRYAHLAPGYLEKAVNSLESI